MLTDRGWAATGAGAALVLLWMLLGEVELLAAGGILLTAAIVAIAFVRNVRPEVSIVRHLSPAMVHEGDRVTVDALVSNRRRRLLRNASLVDDVERLGTAEFQIGALGGGDVAHAAYQIICRPRGVYRVGPAAVEVSDPFRLAAVRAGDARVDRLIVYPASEELIGFPTTRGRDPSTHASRPEFSHRGGEDFYTLREYRQGDDLRFVHWPSSARRDELMIRQLETPWQSRALVLLDLRRGVYESEACFEKAVKGAASIVRYLAESGFDADLWAGGTSTIRVADYPQAMEALALVDSADHLDLRAAAGRLAGVGRGGALVLVTGVPDHVLLEVHRLFGREYGTTVVMTAAETTSSNEAAFHRAGATTVRVAPTDSWAEAWTKAMDRSWGSVSAG
ncbi:MAG: DUF58 domain-containing protein [Acidimicrobiia bacterium]|nr:DUF58 domain-containing protein [Acidimicrobiia bacterium]MDH4307823.1 DUF58 domain-containing protein [Acidimicrobiia bacterium]